MDGELAKVFESYSDLQLRHLALVTYYTESKARQYIRSPLREFGGLSAAQLTKLVETYRRARMDARLLEAQQRCWACNSVALTVHPGLTPLSASVSSWIPADVRVYGDPTIDDIREADKVEVRTPVRRDSMDGVDMIWYGVRVYTRDAAYLEIDGKRHYGLFEPSGKNPLGYPPLVAVRLASPQSGMFWPHPPGDVLSVQIGTIIAGSDMELIVRMKVSPREVVTGSGANKAVSMVEGGPNSIMGLSGGNLTYTATSLDPRIDRYIEAIEWTQRQWAIMRHLNPEGGPWSSTGITGAAKEVERDAEVQDQYRQEQVWREAERDLAEVVADVSRLGPSVLSIPRPDIEVDFRYIEPRQNDLQWAQSATLLCALGLESSSRLYAERERVSMEQARERTAENLDEWAQLLESWRGPAGQVEAPPGMDDLARQVLP